MSRPHDVPWSNTYWNGERLSGGKDREKQRPRQLFEEVVMGAVRQLGVKRPQPPDVVIVIFF